MLAAIPEPVVGAAGLIIYALIATMGFGMLSRENLSHGTNGIVVAPALCVGLLPVFVPGDHWHDIRPIHPLPALIETSHTAYDDGMTGLSEATRRRTQGTCASAVFGWLFVLFAMVSCCSITAPAAHASDIEPAAVARTITPTHQALARIVVADSPEDRGMGSSCHGSSEHSTPVVLPGQSAPAALPGTTVTAPVAPLTGAAAIRGPSNDAVREVDHLRLQVQRI